VIFKLTANMFFSKPIYNKTKGKNINFEEKNSFRRKFFFKKIVAYLQQYATYAVLRKYHQYFYSFLSYNN